MTTHTNKLIQVIKTSLASGGDVFFKTGTVVLFVTKLTDHYGMDKEAPRIAIYTVLCTGVLYNRYFTRVKTMWKKFDGNTPLADPASNNILNKSVAEEYIGNLTYILGTTRSITLLLKSFVSSYVLFSVIGIKNNPVLYTLSTYSALSNAIVFQVYNVKRAVINAKKVIRIFFDHSSSEGHSNGMKSQLAKTIIVGLLGVTSYSAFTYVLTMHAFSVIPGLKLAPPICKQIISGYAAGNAAYTVSTAKGVAFHEFMGSSLSDMLKKISPENKNWVPPHIFFGVLYTIAMGVSFFSSSVSLIEGFGASDSTAWIGIYMLLALCGMVLEFSFNVVPTLKSLQSTEMSQPLLSRSASRNVTMFKVQQDDETEESNESQPTRSTLQ